MKLTLTRLELLEAVESYWGRRKTGRQVLVVASPPGNCFNISKDGTFEFEATPIDETKTDQ